MRMPRRIEVLDAAHVFRPANRFRVLRAGEDEAALRLLLRDLHKEFIDLRLPVGCVGAHITQVATIALPYLAAVIESLVEAAIQRQRSLGFEYCLEFIKERAPSEAEVEIDGGNLVAAQIWRAAFGA